MNTTPGRLHLSPAMKMADLMDIDASLLGVFNRIGLRYGFGESSVEEACQQAGLDADTFLLLCQIYAQDGEKPARESVERASLHDVLTYLRKSHRYYTEVMVPDLARALERLVASCEPRQQEILWKFFTHYKEELDLHFAYEENTVFPYIEAMLNNERSRLYTMDEYGQNHTNVQEKLSDLKNLIMMYLPAECDQQDANQALYCLFNLERDLAKHTFIEDDVLLPAATQLEERVAVTKAETEELSPREKEILVSVAKGMLNKEIADQYNISIYTVITHRKNITRKTGIKTVAGLTVYAILNNLIDMNSVE